MFFLNPLQCKQGLHHKTEFALASFLFIRKSIFSEHAKNVIFSLFSSFVLEYF
jgi:hypothetical protein